MKDNKENQNEFKSDLHEWLAEMKRRREVNRKRDEEQARWDAQFNAPLNESFFKAKLHFVALVNQQIAMER